MMGHLEALGSNQQDQGENNKQTTEIEYPCMNLEVLENFMTAAYLLLVYYQTLQCSNYYSGELKNGSQEVFRGGVGFSGLNRIKPLHLKLCRPDSIFLKKDMSFILNDGFSWSRDLSCLFFLSILIQNYTTFKRLNLIELVFYL